MAPRRGEERSDEEDAGECFSLWLIEWVDQLGAVDLCRRVEMTGDVG
jgi:hypothetical protein